MAEGDVMREDLSKKVTAAKRQTVDGSLELWNARLELLSDAGDIRAIVDHLKSPAEPVADNGNCGNCGCGLESVGSEVLGGGLKR
jgi:hypothetical protein